MKHRLITAVKCILLIAISLRKESCYLRPLRKIRRRACLDCNFNHTLYTYSFVYNLSKAYDEVFIKARPRFLAKYNETLMLLQIKNVFIDAFGRTNRDFDLTFADYRSKQSIFIDYDVFPVTRKAKTLLLPVGLSPRDACELWNEHGELRSTPKKIRVLFCGSGFEGEKYDDISMEKYFGMATRKSQIDALVNAFDGNGLYFCDSNERLRELIDSKSNKFGLVLINPRQCPVDHSDWLKLMASADFFLALPGQAMPHCSNLLESMMVGAIPITGYYDQIVPSLVPGENCLAAKSQDEIVKAVLRAINSDASEMQYLRGNAISYFEKYVKPEGYISELKSGTYATVEMIAEWHSVDLYKRGLPGSPLLETAVSADE